MIRAATSVARNIFGMRTPVLLLLKPTYRCNMHCRFCSVWKSKSEELNTSGFNQIISQAASLGCTIINFSGGEPMLRKDIINLIGYAKRKGFMTMMNSNGYEIEKKVSRLSRKLDYLIISLDFPTAVEHDRFRGKKGAFAEAVRGIVAAKSHIKAVNINCIVMKGNISKLSDMAHLAQNLGVRISFLPFTPERMDRVSKGIRISTSEYIEAVRSLKKKHPQVGPENYFLNAIQTQKFSCHATDTVINVQPDGRFVLPCEVKPIARGNALDLKHEYYSDKVISISKRNGTYEFCKGCASQCSLLPSLLLNPFNAMEAYLKRN